MKKRMLVNETAKLLVSVGAYGRGRVLFVQGQAADVRINLYGDRVDHHIKEYPTAIGIHIWEGVVDERPDGMQWTGTWRPPQADEWDRLARGVPVWGDP